METSVILNKAADLIERDGWWSDTHRTTQGNCAGNAIRKVAGRGHPAQRVLYTYLGGTKLTDTYDWNDAPERTQAEVVEVLRACAVIEAARESRAVEVVSA